MQLIYSGPHPEVVVDELDQEFVIVRGEATEIPDDLAARLLEQDTWEQAQSSSSRASSPSVLASQPTSTGTTPASTDDSKAGN